MKKIHMVSLICLLLITTSACTPKKEDNKLNNTETNRTTDLSRTLVTESSIPTIYENTIELKVASPIFNELILDFLENGLTVEYEGEIGAYEYSDEERKNNIIGPTESKIIFSSKDGNAIVIVQFDDDKSFNKYIASLPNGNGEPKLLVSNQYSINTNNRMVMTLPNEIDEQIFNQYQIIFESK